MYRCFVISPFGNPHGTPEARDLHAEMRKLRTQVFEPAEKRCRERGYAVTIATNEEERSITILTSTLRGIQDADAIIGVLTADRPNVYLEIGWASSFWHKIIYVQRRDYVLPADINNAKIGAYYSHEQLDGSDEPGRLEAIDRLATRIIEEVTRQERDMPFEHFKDTTRLSVGSSQLFNRFSRAVTPADWSRMLQKAESEIIIASSKLRDIRKHPFPHQMPDGQDGTALTSLLLLKALEGVKVTVIIYHPDNPTLRYLLKGEDARADIDSALAEARTNIESSFGLWCQFVSGFRQSRQATLSQTGRELPLDNVKLIQMRERFLPFRVTLTDKQALITFRFFTESYNSGLCLVTNNGGPGADEWNLPIYQMVRNDLRMLVEENQEASEQSYREWEERRRA
ncbi:hypothetical protein [Mangrovibrevibacter kandeliae]|uniref:hypothetical protein n=1 Tax=Mangrovibrevibacter kandeliae TaxID=2968473 RepID=UPI002118405C|nr:hypothetical protein [Aurantimonas sp. CSK15Z-1]MCQ8782271.1 hypothetical protein [Aurantimonas sp. CSK15Z-1]